MTGYPSYINTTTDLGEPSVIQVWRTDDGDRVCGAVDLGCGQMVFRSPAHARKLAAVLTDCAAQMEALAAEAAFERTQPGTHLATEPNGDNDQ